MLLHNYVYRLCMQRTLSLKEGL